MEIKGSWVALVTPFNESGIDYDQLHALIEFHITHQTDGIVIAGTTGESATLSLQEKKELFIKARMSAANRIPLMANIGTNNTAESIELALYAEGLGYDALLAVCPYYNKPSQRGLIAHFSAIAHATSLPIILYNVPSRTSSSLQLSSVVELSHLSNIVGIKEASGDLHFISQIVEAVHPDFSVLSGNDDLIVDQLAVGASGVISVVANAFPEAVKALVTFYNTDLAASYQSQAVLNILNDVLYLEPNPVGIKALMSLVSLPVGPTRLPLVSLDETQQAKLVAAYNSYMKEAKPWQSS